MKEQVKINESRNFKGLWIDEKIFTDRNLTRTERDALVEIINLCEKGKCFASNQHFADFLGVKKSTAANIIYSLRKKGYVNITLTYKDGSKEIDKRLIEYADPYSLKNEYPIHSKMNTPIHFLMKDKNTVFKNPEEEYTNEEDKERIPDEPKSSTHISSDIPDDKAVEVGTESTQWHWKNGKTYLEYLNKVMIKYLWSISNKRYNNAERKQKFVNFWEQCFKMYFNKHHFYTGNLHPWYSEENLEKVMNNLYKFGMTENRDMGSVDMKCLEDYIDRFYSHKNLGCDYNMLVFSSGNMLKGLYAEITDEYDDYMEAFS